MMSSFRREVSPHGLAVRRFELCNDAVRSFSQFLLLCLDACHRARVRFFANGADICGLDSKSDRAALSYIFAKWGISFWCLIPATDDVDLPSYSLYSKM